MSGASIDMASSHEATVYNYLKATFGAFRSVSLLQSFRTKPHGKATRQTNSVGSLSSGIWSPEIRHKVGKNEYVEHFTDQ